MALVHKNCRIAYGCMRVVWLIGQWAIKFPAMVEWRLFLLGLLANMQERQWSKTGWPELCPVVWSIPGGWIIIMKRARVMTNAEFNNFDSEKWRDKGDYMIPAEDKQNSFGWYQDKIVVIDYGN